eukprot:COSAG02_NODE_10918_length_1832_cov_1.241200_2_plen_41_part_00
MHRCWIHDLLTIVNGMRWLFLVDLSSGALLLGADLWDDLC